MGLNSRELALSSCSLALFCSLRLGRLKFASASYFKNPQAFVSSNFCARTVRRFQLAGRLAQIRLSCVLLCACCSLQLSDCLFSFSCSLAPLHLFIHLLFNTSHSCVIYLPFLPGFFLLDLFPSLSAFRRQSLQLLISCWLLPNLKLPDFFSTPSLLSSYYSENKQTLYFGNSRISKSDKILSYSTPLFAHSIAFNSILFV